MSSDERVFRQTFMDNDGNVTYGAEEVIDAGPFATPGVGSFVELEDGWYRLRRRDPKAAPPPNPSESV